MSALLILASSFWPLGCWCCGQTRPADQPRKFSRIREVIDNWELNQHLYVKGDVGVSAGQLQSLEKWLDQNGKNWTIVLMDASQGQSFQTVAEGFYRGREAVYYALGHGLSNQTDFGAQLHPTTQEPYGAIFVLFRQDRKFNYFASDAQDRRGLGEARWFGTLDREAIRAMRNGRRVTDAVKNTVLSINGRLEKQIAAEVKRRQQQTAAAKAAQQQAVAVRSQKIDQLKTTAQESQTTINNRVLLAVVGLKQQFPATIDSELANPPTQAWLDSLQSIARFLANPTLVDDENLLRAPAFVQQKQKLQQVRSAIDRHLDLLAAHESYDAIKAPIETRLDNALFDASGVAGEAAEQGFKLLELADQEHRSGSVDFRVHLNDAEAIAEQCEQKLNDHRAEQARQERRSSIIRRTVGWTLSGLGALLAVVMTSLNVVRRKYLNQAYQLFHTTQDDANKMDAAAKKLLQRTTELIGNRKSFTQRGFVAKTQQEGLQALRQGEQLKLMSAEAQRPLLFCQRLLSPPNILGQAANMVSSRRYQQCIHILESKSFQLPKNPVNPELDPSWGSFEAFRSDHTRRCGRLQQRLDQFERSFDSIEPEMKRLNLQIDQLVQQDQQVMLASKRDRYFDVPAMFDVLIPAIQRDWDQISATTSTDPLTVTDELLPAAFRKLNDGNLVLKTIQTARENVLPMLDQAADRLKRLGHDHRWIQQSALQLSAPANHLLELAANQPVADQAQQFDQDVLGLGVRAKRTSELADQLANPVQADLQRLEKRINRDRRQIADSLDLPEAAALSEIDYNPTACLQLAHDQFQAAKAAATHGRVGSIEESMEVIRVEIGRADQMIDASFDALKNNPVDLANHQQTIQRLIGDARAGENKIQQLQQSFSPASFEIRPEIAAQNDLLTDDDSVSLEVLLQMCRDSITHCEKLVESGQADHRQARLLTAANHALLARAELQQVDSTLAAVRDHCRRMGEQDLTNQQTFPVTQGRVDDAVGLKDDLHSQQSTLELISQLERKFGEFEVRFSDAHQPRSPFLDADQITGFHEQLDEITAAMRADVNAHHEASRALAGAKRELSIADQLNQKSADDQIPDSREIKLCRSATETVRQQLLEIESRLSTPHENWPAVGEAATKANTRLAVTIGELQRQLQLAQQAAKHFRAAASAVLHAADWRGSYGILVDGRPGSADLENARGEMERGQYRRCIQFSRSAKQTADRAVQAAENEVQAERRRIARQAEERRRRRRRQQSTLFGSSSKSSFRFGSRSSGSSFGSSSRSSSSSSSGFGRESGW